MPNNSNARQRYFQYLESKGRLPKKQVDEFSDLPGYAEGGMVEDLYDAEELQEEDLEFGEPDPGSPKKFLRMAKGGKVRDPNFVKAIRKSMY
jgi:hypothetical protein